MNDLDPKLARLLRSSVHEREEISPEVPFGFDTRVVALWRAAKPGSNGLGRFLRRVAVSAVGVIVIASAGAFYEFQQEGDDDDASGSEFAIADSAIQNEFLQ